METHKKRRREIALENLSYAHSKTKKIKLTKSQSPIRMNSQAQKELPDSQKIQVFLRKQVKDIDWSQKRIYAVHSYYFLKDLGISNCSLIAKCLNIKDGGNQPALRDTVWKGEVQKLTLEDGTPKGLRRILQERGLFKDTMEKEKIIKVLSKCEEFLAEKPPLQKLIKEASSLSLATRVSLRIEPY